MVCRSDAGRSHVELARIGFGESNEFRNGLGRNRRIDLHHLGHPIDAGDRRDVAEKDEAELVVERRVDSVAGINQEKRVAIRRRAYSRLSGDIAIRAWPILDDEWLTETLGQP